VDLSYPGSLSATLALKCACKMSTVFSELYPRDIAISSINPANGQRVADVTSALPVEVEQAISQAHEVFEEGIWSRSSVQHRSSILSNLARSLESRVDELATLESLQTGFLVYSIRGSFSCNRQAELFAR
jgi:acyl-CoA reductase-like NAD-dependent aldehyde dehydrogenase